MKRKNVDREKVTPEILGAALRHLRTTMGLTQRGVAERATPYCDQGSGRLLESQISDFERGRSMPAMRSLLNFLAGCCDGNVDFRTLQRSIEVVCAREEGEVGDAPTEAGPERLLEMFEQATVALSERLAEQLREETQGQKAEMAELRTRVVCTERLLASLVGSSARQEVQPEGPAPHGVAEIRNSFTRRLDTRRQR